ncbi:MAG: hypothetical protein IIC82_05245, partial [Chloroflexi bacterium]|nr:hypothetical protein [Chloroflexota bacterium]
MKRKTPKIIRFLMVAALLAGILGALVPVGRVSAGHGDTAHITGVTVDDKSGTGTTGNARTGVALTFTFVQADTALGVNEEITINFNVGW